MVEMFIILALISFILMVVIKNGDKGSSDLDVQKHGKTVMLIYRQDDGDKYGLNITPSEKNIEKRYSIKRRRKNKVKSFPFKPGRVTDETFMNVCKDGYEGKKGVNALEEYFDDLKNVRDHMRDVLGHEINIIEKNEKRKS